ncbi:MAG: hypothetical protein OEY94_06425 [Alphaproteobacteria bacterium]|nr:hypothetical protein [Alphaproteobacteria bacterium]
MSESKLLSETDILKRKNSALAYIDAASDAIALLGECTIDNGYSDDVVKSAIESIYEIGKYHKGSIAFKAVKELNKYKEEIATDKIEKIREHLLDSEDTKRADMVDKILLDRQKQNDPVPEGFDYLRDQDTGALVPWLD